jgi:hypothetical protein
MTPLLVWEIKRLVFKLLLLPFSAIMLFLDWWLS